MTTKKLKREIGFLGAFSTVMGTVIGAGVFFKAAAVVALTQSASMTLLVWLLAGFLTICAGLTVAELATAIPETGGAIKYIELTYGKLPAFLLGWAQMIVYFPANIAALSIIFATQLLNLFGWSLGWLIPLAILTAVSVTGINLLGTKAASWVQSGTLLIKLLPIGAIVIAGLLFAPQTPVTFSLLPTGNSWGGLSGALLATLFAYDGWLGVGAMAGEMRRPEKDLPRAIIIGLSFVTFVYLVINFVFLRTLPLSAISGNLNAASDVAVRLFGTQGGKIVTIGILISVYGALNGYTMTGIRVPYAMALEHELPFSSFLSRLNRFAVPRNTALVQLAIAIIMMCLGSFDLLTDMLVFVMWLFSILIFIAVFLLRKREPDRPRPYKVPLYPVVPLIAIGGGLFILVMTLLKTPLLALTGIALTLIGIPIYFFKK